jgi:uncharacterized protein YbjT (DUF2867 family)
MTDRRPLLVLGGTGTTGRRVAAGLAARGRPVRLGSRRGSPPFEWTAPATWPAVVDGAGAAYVVFTPDLSFPGAIEVVEAFAGVATAAGVDRLVLLSGRGEPSAQAAEAALAAVADRAGARWSVVRASWFAQNFSESFLRPLVLDGVLAVPAADVPEPFVDADDIAAVAVAALTEDGHAGEVYEVTGPDALTFAAVAETLTAVIGRSVTFVPLSGGEFVAAAVAGGMPAEEAEGFAELFAAVLDGRNALPQDGVVRALGRSPRPFAEFARAAAADGAWELVRR